MTASFGQWRPDAYSRLCRSRSWKQGLDIVDRALCVLARPLPLTSLGVDKACDRIEAHRVEEAMLYQKARKGFDAWTMVAMLMELVEH